MAFSGQRSDAVAAENQVKLSNLGIPGLEFVTGGGVPEDSVYILTGQPGTYYYDIRAAGDLQPPGEEGQGGLLHL